MFAQYFVQILFIITGTISLLAAVFNWEWFFSTNNVQLLVRNFGRSKARLFYGILGIILWGSGILLNL